MYLHQVEMSNLEEITRKAQKVSLYCYLKILINTANLLHNNTVYNNTNLQTAPTTWTGSQNQITKSFQAGTIASN